MTNYVHVALANIKCSSRKERLNAVSKGKLNRYGTAALKQKRNETKHARFAHAIEPSVSDHPKFSGRLREVVAYNSRTRGVFFREQV